MTQNETVSIVTVTEGYPEESFNQIHEAFGRSGTISTCKGTGGAVIVVVEVTEVTCETDGSVTGEGNDVGSETLDILICICHFETAIVPIAINEATIAPTRAPPATYNGVRFFCFSTLESCSFSAESCLL